MEIAKKKKKKKKQPNGKRGRRGRYRRRAVGRYTKIFVRRCVGGNARLLLLLFQKCHWRTLNFFYTPSGGRTVFKNKVVTVGFPKIFRINFHFFFLEYNELHTRRERKRPSFRRHVSHNSENHSNNLKYFRRMEGDNGREEHVRLCFQWRW